MPDLLTYSTQIRQAAEMAGVITRALPSTPLAPISTTPAADGGWIDEVHWQGVSLRQWRAAPSDPDCLQAAWALMPQLGFDGADALLLAGALATQAARVFPQSLQWPTQVADFPLSLAAWMPASMISATHLFPAHHFAPCQSAPLGFYPVVDSLALLERLLALGVRTLQLRIKAPFNADVDAQIAAAVALGRHYQAQLFINDHWQAALQHGAYGVHLGQEDLALADLSALAAAGLRLGVSTHGYAEVLQALALQPSYIALGHIFPTPTKQMPSRPQGLGRLRQLQALVGSIPTVAIGGIDLPCAPQVLACGVGSIAVVRAVTQAEDLAATVQRWQSLWQGNTPLSATAEEAVKC